MDELLAGFTSINLKMVIMYVIGLVLIVLAIKKNYSLLLLPIVRRHPGEPHSVVHASIASEPDLFVTNFIKTTQERSICSNTTF